MTAIFLSDVHLRDGTSAKSRVVVKFLQEVASRFDRVIVLGDLLDVWPGTTKFLIRQYGPILEALADLVRAGQEVHYVEGNHDFLLGEYFSRELGIRVHTDDWVETWAGKKIYIAHGDLGNSADRTYPLIRKFLRAPPIHWVKSLLPGSWAYHVGVSSSKLSRHLQKRSEAEWAQIEEKVRVTYRNSAQDLFKKGYDVVIMGHTHVPDDFKVDIDGRTCRYLNTGDWVRNFTYLEFDGLEFYTKRHPVTTTL